MRNLREWWNVTQRHIAHLIDRAKTAGHGISLRTRAIQTAVSGRRELLDPVLDSTLMGTSYAPRQGKFEARWESVGPSGFLLDVFRALMMVKVKDRESVVTPDNTFSPALYDFFRCLLESGWNGTSNKFHVFDAQRLEHAWEVYLARLSTRLIDLRECATANRSLFEALPLSLRDHVDRFNHRKRSEEWTYYRALLFDDPFDTSQSERTCQQHLFEWLYGQLNSLPFVSKHWPAATETSAPSHVIEVLPRALVALAGHDRYIYEKLAQIMTAIRTYEEFGKGTTEIVLSSDELLSQLVDYLKNSAPRRVVDVTLPKPKK